MNRCRFSNTLGSRSISNDCAAARRTTMDRGMVANRADWQLALPVLSFIHFRSMFFETHNIDARRLLENADSLTRMVTAMWIERAAVRRHFCCSLECSRDICANYMALVSGSRCIRNAWSETRTRRTQNRSPTRRCVICSQIGASRNTFRAPKQS